MKSSQKLNRREFISKMTSSAIGLTIIPSYVMGINGKTPPNDRINVALIGCGTQALRQLPDWLKREELQFVAVYGGNRKEKSKGLPAVEKSGGNRLIIFMPRKPVKALIMLVQPMPIFANF